MNVLEGEITTIITEEDLSLVKINVGGHLFTSIVIDTPATSPYLKQGNPVRLLFKETEVIIARIAPIAISIQNKMECSIIKITTGKILCQLDLLFRPGQTGPASRQSFDLTPTPGQPGAGWSIRSLITRNACEQLQLQENDTILAMVKTNEVSLSAYD